MLKVMSGNVFYHAKKRLSFANISSKIFLSLIIFSCALFLSVKSVSAATYYVDATNGLDTNTGTSTDQAWQTLNKVQTSSFSAGDSILLKRGEIWREQLNFPSSGSSSNPITIGAYDSGDKPIIYGSTLLDGSWTNVSGTIYKISLATETQTVINGTTNLTKNEGNFASLTDGQWDWEGSELYVNIGSDPTGGTIEAGQRNYAIWLNGKNYITVEDIIARNVNVSAYFLHNGSNNIIFNNVEGYSNGNEAFKQQDTTSATYNNVIGNYNLDDGFSLHDSAIAIINTGTFNNNVSGIQNVYSSQITASNLTVNNNSDNGFNVLYSAGGTGGISSISDSSFSNNLSNIYVEDDQKITIDNVTISGGTFGLHVNTPDVTQTVDDLTVSGTSNYAVYLQDGTINANKVKITDTAVHAINVNAGNLSLSNALIYSNVAASQYSLVIRTGVTSTVKNSVFYGNTHGIFLAGTGTLNLYNTIVSNVGNGILFASGATASNATLSNNNFYNNAANFSGASPTNTDGLAVDSLFYDAASGDFSLQSDSTLINAGTDVSLSSDYLGNLIYDEPDIGAYELQPPYQVATNEIDVDGDVRIYANGKFRNTQTASGTTASLSISPSEGFNSSDSSVWMNLSISQWNTSGDYAKTWTESSDTIGSGSTLHTVGDLAANGQYVLKVDDVQGANITGSDCNNGICTANNSGQITFTYTGGYSTHTFSITQYTPSTDNSSSNNTPAPSTPTCQDKAPVGQPDLFQIDRSGKQAKLYFTPVNDKVETYHVVFGFSEGDERFGGINIQAQNDNQGVQYLLVDYLNPNKEYSFKVISVNGCAPGEWSNWLSVGKVQAKTSIFYRYWETVKNLF